MIDQAFRRGIFGRLGLGAGVIVTAVCGLSIGPLSAAPGGLDPTFGTDGLIAVSYGDGYTPEASAIAESGKIVVGGVQTIAGVDHAQVRRLKRNGSPDPTFAGGGTVDLGPNTSLVSVVPVGSSVFVIGSTTDGDLLSWVTVWKLTDSGALDPLFDSDGIATPAADLTVWEEAVDGVVDGAGRVVVLARNHFVGVVVYRVTTAGVADSSFSDDGVNAFMLNSSNNFPAAIVTTRSNKVVVVGQALLDIGADDKLEIGVAVARLTTAGVLDTGFAGDGIRTVGQGLGTSLAPRDVVISGSGSIVVVGSESEGILTRDTRVGAERIGFVLRLTSAGLRDSAFGSNGYKRLSIGTSFTDISRVAVQSDGKLLVAATAGARTGLARLKPLGGFDKSFSGDGKRTIRFPGTTASEPVGADVTPNAKRLIVVSWTGGASDGVGLAAVSLV